LAAAVSGKAQSFLSSVIEQNRDRVVRSWFRETQENAEIVSIQLSDSERKGDVPQLLDQAIAITRGKEISDEDRRGAVTHDAASRNQGYTLPLIIQEAKILQKASGAVFRSTSWQLR